MRHGTRLLCVTLGAVLWGTASCSKPPTPPPTEVTVVCAPGVPADPADAAWQSVPEYTAVLVPQDLVEPRQLAPTTATVRVRAISNGTETAFRLEWTDATRDDLPGAARFCDACAVQLPQTADVNLPAPQMGEIHRGVEIAYWNASCQALVDGRGPSIKELYPNASVDHYPFEAKPLEKSPASQQAMASRYAPAHAVGNPLAGPPATSVQDLIAEGPGTLTPAPSSSSRGRGLRTADGWAVVIVRSRPIALTKERTNIAFAVWDGAQAEVGARKMRTAWIPMSVRGNVK